MTTEELKAARTIANEKGRIAREAAHAAHLQLLAVTPTSDPAAMADAEAEAERQERIAAWASTVAQAATNELAKVGER